MFNRGPGPAGLLVPWAHRANIALGGILVLPSRVCVRLRLRGGPPSAAPQFSSVGGQGPIVVTVPFPLHRALMQPRPLRVSLTV